MRKERKLPKINNDSINIQLRKSLAINFTINEKKMALNSLKWQLTLTYKETNGITDGQARDVQRHRHVPIVPLNHHLKDIGEIEKINVVATDLLRPVYNERK